MAVKVLSMIENYTSYGFGDAGKMYHSSDGLSGRGVEYVLPEQRSQTPGTRFAVCFWDSNCVGRQETGGPVSQRAHASLSAQASMIYSGPRRPEPAVEKLYYGDYLVLEGLDTILKVIDGGRWRGPELEVVVTPEASVDYSEIVEAENAKPKRYVSEAWLSG